MNNIALSEASAAVLFDTIDESLGIFQKDTMEKKDWKFWGISRANFIQMYSHKVPLAYWFTTLKVPSVNLLFVEEKFVVTSDSTNFIGELYNCNSSLADFNHNYLSDATRLEKTE